MLQEQSVKKLAKSLYRGLATHFYYEFKSKLELYLDQDNRGNNNNNNYQSNMIQQQQQQNTSNMQQVRGISPSGMNSNMNNNQTMAINRSQQQSYDSRKDLPPKGRITGIQSQMGNKMLREDNTQDVRVDDSRYQNMQGGGSQNVNFSRDETPNPKGLNSRMNNQNSIHEDSGQLGSQYRKAVGGSILRKSNINEVSMEHNQTMGGGGGPGGSRILKQTQQSGTNMQSVNMQNQSRNISQQEANRSNDANNKRGFLRVGDIISLAYNEKVYDGDSKAKKKLDSEGQNVNLAKITEKPKMIYKGIIWSNFIIFLGHLFKGDGVTNKSFNVIPKQIDLPYNAGQQFQKCLFRLEIAQECKYSIIYQKLESELVELERDLDDSDKDEKEHIVEKIVEVKQKMKDNDVFLKEEIRNNEYELKMNLGQKIFYGQKIQLKHLFSEQYLTLNEKKITQEHGCVAVTLSSLCNDSYFTLLPSQKIKFSGQAISYQDTFHIQNYISDIVQQTRFFVHINSVEIEESGEMASLEINASHEPSKIRAKLFMDHNYLYQQKTCIHSGDPIKLFHKEVKGYLTVNQREVDLVLPQFPDFLQKQIKALNSGANRVDQLIDEEHDNNAVQQNDEKKLQSTKIYIERDPECLFETNCFWEIQKVKPFMGGSILWDDIYRFRHIGTGKYLCVSPEKLELSLKFEADTYDTLFRIRRESFQPFKGAFYDELKPGENIVLENYYQKYIQIYQDLNNDQLEKYNYKVRSMYHRYSSESQESQIPTVCGNFSKDDVSKMVFEIQEVPKSKALIAYQAQSYYDSFKNFYSYLNYWAVSVTDDDEDSYDKHKYDPEDAVQTEYQLMQSVEDFLQCLLFMDRLLHNSIDEGKLSYISTQNYLSEQGILNILVKILELIYYKTVPPEERELPFLSSKSRGMRKIKVDDNDAELIAREYLDSLAEKIMKSIILLIRFNESNANIMTKYDVIIYNMLQRYDTRLVAKIFTETFKRATYIFNDRSAAIMTEQGLNLKIISQMQDSGVGNHFNQTFSNQMNKWAEMLETVSYMDERDQNIDKQILYLKVIGLMCCDSNGKALYHYQMQAAFCIVSNEQNVPMRFSIQKRDVERVYVSFIKKNKESSEIFFLKNPNLREIFKQNTSAYAKDYEVTFDLSEITQKYETTMPYINYICSVLDLFTRMCADRNADSIKKVRELGLSADLVILCMTTKTIHEKLKSAFVALARVLFVDVDPFPKLSKSKNRCYFWDGVGKAHVHRTMYGWEKIKYQNVHENKIMSNAQEQLREAAEKVRHFVNEFFKSGPSDIIEFLYSYASKTYTKADIDPKLKLFINNIEVAMSLIDCEHVDSLFIYSMIKVASLLFLSYNIIEVPDEGEKSWVVRFMKVSKQHKACQNKIELLEQKVLQMLQMICKYRMNFQIMIFLKLFKKSQEDNDLPSIFIDQTEHDQKFNIIFSLYQFNIDKNSSSRILEELKFLLVDNPRQNKAKKMTLLELEDLQLSDLEDQQFDDPTMKSLQKKQYLNSEKELTDAQKKALELKKKKKLKNRKFSLYEFLIYLLFSKPQNNHLIKTQTVELLVANFKQRQNLLQELIKVELLISQQDQSEYYDFKFQTFRLSEHIDQLAHDDLHYLLYMNIDKDKYKKCVHDVINILRGLTQSLTNDPTRMFRKQNMLRHLDVSEDILGKMMKNLYYKPADHFDLYNETSKFLFMYSYQNTNNQRSLLPHLNFLCNLLDYNIPNTKLISQVIWNNKKTPEGVQFLEYLLSKLVKQNYFKSYIMKLLVIMTIENESNQIMILKRLIKRKRFRQRLYLSAKNTASKLELLVVFKKKMNQIQSQKLLKNDEDWERICIHLSTVDLLAACAKDSMYGILQARKLIEVECLFDSINSEGTPYMCKKHYLRLLYEVYINDVSEVSNMNLNSEKFVHTLRFVVLEDLKQYPYFYTGLVTKLQPDAKRDNDNEKNRDNKILSLEKMSKMQVQKLAQERTAIEYDNFKEQRSRISNLKTSKPFPFVNDLDFQEYWNYLNQFQKSHGKADGLLHFIRDFYRNVRKTKFKINKEVVDITEKIKDILIKMSDDLHSINEKVSDNNLIDIDQIIFHINEAVASIPTVKKQIKDDMLGLHNQDQHHEDEEAEILTQESQINNDLDDSRMLDIRMASDNILRIVRDYIISRNCTIKDAFDIQSISNDEYISKFQLKKKLKDIAGHEASFDDIDKAISFFVDFSKEQQQERKIMQVEIGQEGHIHTHNNPRPESDLTFNFRDFEILLKKILQKAGYKPPKQKRDRAAVQDENIEFKMTLEELSVACNNDLKLYTKCFFDFCHKYASQDELKDLIIKISKILNRAFEKNQTEVIKEFIENTISGFKNADHKLFLVRILKMILEQYTPKNFDEDTEQEVLIVAKRRLNQLQQIYFQCKVFELLLMNISKDEKPELSHECLLLLTSLLCEAEQMMQDELLKLLKSSKQHYLFFEYIQFRLFLTSEKLIRETVKKFEAQTLNEDELEQEQNRMKFLKILPKTMQRYGKLGKNFNKDRVLTNLNQQPFYMNQNFDLETELEALQNHQISNELKEVLKLVQMLCRGGHQGFQNYLRNQDMDYDSYMSSKNGQGSTTIQSNDYISSINVVVEIANMLLRLTVRLTKSVFEDIIVFETVDQIFKSLIDLQNGPCSQNQKLLGFWKNFCHCLNFFFSQDLGIYAANTTVQKSKLILLYQSSRMLTSLIESNSKQFVKEIIQEMSLEIKTNNLKQKLVDIFQFKIGGDEKKMHIYQADLHCTHYLKHGITRQNMCEKDEYCQYGHYTIYDEKIIQAAFHIFTYIYCYNEVMPDSKDIKDCDFEMKNDDYYNEFKEIYIAKLHKKTRFLKIEALGLKEDHIQNEVEKKQKAEDLLQKMALLEPSRNMFPVLVEDAKEKEDQDILEQGIDFEKTTNVINQYGELIEEESVFEEQIVIRSQTTRFGKKQEGKWKKYCCQRSSHDLSFSTKILHALLYCTCCTRCRKQNRMSYNKVAVSAKTNGEGDRLAGPEQMDDLLTQEEQEMKNSDKAISKKRKQGGIIKKEQQDLRLLKRSMRSQFKLEPVYSFEQFKLDTALRFFLSNLGSVEILNHNHELGRVMFKIPSFCNFMSEQSRKDLSLRGWKSSQVEKVGQIFQKINLFEAEMMSIQRLAKRSQILTWISLQYNNLSICAYWIIVIINLLLLIYYQEDPNQGKAVVSNSTIQSLISLLAIIQLIMASSVMISYFQRFHGVFYQKHLEKQKAYNMVHLTNFRGTLGYSKSFELIKDPDQDMQKIIIETDFRHKNKHQNQSILKLIQDSLKYTFYTFYLGLKMDRVQQFNQVHLILSTIGLFYNITFSFMLLEIVLKLPLLTIALKAFVVNIKQLIYTFILVVILVYIYAVIAIEAFNSYYYDDSSTTGGTMPEYNGYCQSLIMCFTTTLNNGLRASGGIGDSLEQPTDQDNLYWGRWFFDLTFFLIIIILLLNLVLGIIIDAFADIRDRNKQIKSDMNEKCFICGLTKQEFEKRSKSFQIHILKEHNLYSYLYFILYLQHKDDSELTGLEKMVKQKIYKKDVSFFPTNKCIQFQDEIQYF